MHEQFKYYSYEPMEEVTVELTRVTREEAIDPSSLLDSILDNTTVKSYLSKVKLVGATDEELLEAYNMNTQFNYRLQLKKINDDLRTQFVEYAERNTRARRGCKICGKVDCPSFDVW